MWKYIRHKFNRNIIININNLKVTGSEEKASYCKTFLCNIESELARKISPPTSTTNE